MSDEAPDEIDELIAEYLLAQEERRELPLEDLEARAGDRIGELHQAIADMAELEATRDLLRESARAAIQVPEYIGHVRVVEEIGLGSFGRIFRGYDERLERHVAIKALEAWGPGHRQWVWALAEARALAQVSHEGVVKVHEVLEWEGKAYIIMDLLEGTDLAKALDVHRGKSAELEPGPLKAVARLESRPEQVEFLIRLASALAACHSEEVAHRDVKPSNIQLDSDAHPILLDFGLASLDLDPAEVAKAKKGAGTAAYMPPERLRPRKEAPPDPYLGDMYSFGIVMWELLTLRSPEVDGNPWVGQRRSFDPRAVDPTIDSDLATIVRWCTHRDPKHRYASMAVVRAELKAFREHRPILARPVSQTRRARLWFRRLHPATKVAAALLPLALLGLLGAWFMNWSIWGGEQVREVQAAMRSLDEVDDPRAAGEAINLLTGKREVVEVLERLVWGGLVVPELENQVHRYGNALRDALESSLIAAYERDESELSFEARAHRLDTMDDRWAFVLHSFEPVFAREGLPSSVDAFLGGLEIPTRGRLLRYETGGSPYFPELVEVKDVSHAPSGRYRFAQDSSQGKGEIEFYVDEREAPWRLSARTLDPQLSGVFVKVPSFTIRDRALGTDYGISPFRTTLLTVSWQDLEAAFRPGEVDDAMGWIEEVASSHPDLGLGQVMAPTAPAYVSWWLAREYARRVGARLPTAPELWAIRSQEEPGFEFPAPTEWTSGYAGGEVVYMNFRVPEGMPYQRTLSLAPDPAAPTIGRAFRVVISGTE